MRKKFWNFETPEAGRGELTLYGDISDTSWWGDEVTPAQFREDLDALGDVNELDIYINSGGGDVFAGIAIYNMLRRHPARKVVRIDGLAASIASVIAMAGDEIVMAENAMMMIHEAWTMVGGNKRELRKVAEELERIDGVLAFTYTARSGGEEKDIKAMLEAETWMTAKEAVAKGFADRVEPGLKAAASVRGSMLTMNGEQFDLTRYLHPPEIEDEAGAPAPEKTADHGGASQPVADKALMEQRRKFAATRRKILEAFEGGKTHGKAF